MAPARLAHPASPVTYWALPFGTELFSKSPFTSRFWAGGGSVATSLFVIVHVAALPSASTTALQPEYDAVYPVASTSVTVYVPGCTVSSLLPSASKLLG